jgi:hypothetical protein
MINLNEINKQELAAILQSPLLGALGEICNPKLLFDQLRYLPPLPTNLNQTPFHIRLQQMQTLWDLCQPGSEVERLAASIDVMIRQNYKNNNPINPETWRLLYGVASSEVREISKPSCVTVMGIPGVGEREWISKILSVCPSPVHKHKTFPNIVSELLPPAEN